MEFIYEHVTIAQRSDVTDGDTIVFTIDLGFKVAVRETFRILELDTYETTRRIRHGIKCTVAEAKKGKEAKKFAQDLLMGKRLKLVVEGKTGKYGRWLAHLWVEQTRAPDNVEIATEGEHYWLNYAEWMRFEYDRDKNPI
ncbi:MAG: thermonuclease family protein [Algicola sp.]|nr:thermonuclease family protein [Algicola sp.]